MSQQSAKSLAKNARVSCLKAVHVGKTSHVGSSLSGIDILAVLYSGAANVDPGNPDMVDRDIVVLSKGHAAAGLYSVLANAGFFPVDWLDDYCADGSLLGGHVTHHGVPGVELSTGSLGHGLPFGVGAAIAAKRQGRSSRTFVVVSDGECDEGTTWESALIAGHHELGNLTVVVDRNHIQSLAPTEDTLRLEPFADKWRSFGWEVSEVDGHDYQAIEDALGHRSNAPHVLICDTVKGKGVSFMENTVLWHYRSPSDEDLAAALEEVNTAS